MGQKRERYSAVAVADSGSVESAAGQPRRRGLPVVFLSGAGGFEGAAASCFLSIQVSSGGTRDELPSRGIKITILAAYFCSSS